MNETAWESLSPEQKKLQLYENQKRLLDEFLSHGAISRAQYDKSLGDLTEKMGFSSAESPVPSHTP